MNRLHDPDSEWDNVFPLKEWTLEDYKNMFKFISEGYLVQSDDNVGFVISPTFGIYWGWCEPMAWEWPPQADEYNCPHCGDDRGAHDISDRNRLIPCESDGEGDKN